MYCERCGAKLPDESKFCDQCGTPVSADLGYAPGAAAAATVTATVASTAPSAASLAIKRFFSNKRNVLIFALALFVLVAAIVTVILLANRPPKAKTIYLDDYFTVVYDGADGYAEARIRWNETKMNELNSEIFSLEQFNSYEEFLASTDGKFTAYRITDYFDILLSKNTALHNGDQLLVTVNYTHYTYNEDMERDPIDAEDFKEAFNVNLTLRNEALTVEGLPPITPFDPFEHLTLRFDGINGYGRPILTAPEEEISTSNPTKTFRFNVSYGGFDVVLYDNGSYAFTVSYECDRTANLSNGDAVTFTVGDYYTDSSREQLASYGFVLANTQVVKTVSGLTPVVTYSPADNLELVYSGFSGFGTFDHAFPSETVTVGGYTLRFSDDSSTYHRRIHIAILDEDGGTLDSFTYRADIYSELGNGSVITFTSSITSDYIIENYGIDFVDAFTVTVSGMEEALDPALFANASMLFRGYDGYGTAELVPPTEEQQVYTVGTYTFKLTPSSSVSWGTTTYRMTVVVEKDGENILTLYYACSDTDGLNNGDVIAFDCSLYSSLRNQYLNDYGILFPASYTYEVTGLAPTTVTDPREFVTYDFAGTNGNITLTLGLTETSYTVGDYHVALSVTYSQSWGTTYAYLNFTVTDRDGNTVGDGNYRAYASGLEEGEILSLDRYSVDQGAIASACGLLFSNEESTTIVSAK